MVNAVDVFAVVSGAFPVSGNARDGEVDLFVQQFSGVGYRVEPMVELIGLVSPTELWSQDQRRSGQVSLDQSCSRLKPIIIIKQRVFTVAEPYFETQR